MRLKKIEEEYGDQVVLEPRVFMLRPEPDPSAVFNDYRRQHWTNANSHPESGDFRMWESGEEFPTCSMPSAQAGLAARAQGPGEWDTFQWNLLAAMFTENRNISELSVLCDVAEQSGLDADLFRDEVASGIHLQQATKEYTEAINRGVTGIPTVVVNDEISLVGAVPREQYKFVIDHVLEHGQVPRQASPGLPQL